MISVVGYVQKNSLDTSSDGLYFELKTSNCNSKPSKVYLDACQVSKFLSDIEKRSVSKVILSGNFVNQHIQQGNLRRTERYIQANSYSIY